MEVGEAVNLEIDWPRRYALMRLHTAFHVMSCVVSRTGDRRKHCARQGAARFRHRHEPAGCGARSSSETNALIARGLDTETVWITDEELDARPDLVKTMSVQPPRGAGRVRLLRIPGIDLQPCGGTHVQQHRRDRRDPRAEDQERRQAQQAGRDSVGRLISSTVALTSGAGPQEEPMNLKIISRIALCAVAVTTLVHAADYTKPNIKPGLWEVTVTPKMSGEMPIPDDQLAKMTPDQRAKVEAMVKGAGSKPHVYKDCMTPEKIAKGFEMERGADETVLQAQHHLQHRLGADAAR